MDIIDEHTIIRETVGYELISKTHVFDLPVVLQFLKIVYNYNRMTRIYKKIEDETD